MTAAAAVASEILSCDLDCLARSEHQRALRATLTLATIRREGGAEAVRASIVAALATGTPADAARALGCSWASLRLAARRTGVPWPVPGEATRTARAAALARYRAAR